MKQAVTVVEGLSNVQAVLLLEQLYQTIFTSVPYDTVQTHMMTDVDEVIILRDVESETKQQNLTPQDSVEAARHVLMAFAQDDDLAPVLMQVWEDIVQDDSLFVETIVAIGLLTNLTLFMATTEMEFKCKGVKFKKSKPSHKALKEVLKPIVELVRRVP